MEVAFFGGTFTALPQDVFRQCLSAVSQWYNEGIVARARCSTRPDADITRLHTLVEAGFTTVELGIQSFNSAALCHSRRSYDEHAAHKACTAVREAGLTLGVQLLPGMPGVTPDIFVRDVTMALNAGAQLLRFYPCQVLQDTELARLWRAGEYTPWTWEETVDALTEGWLLAHARHVPVIRMGLAPEPGLEQHIVAGPRHPALGALVQGEALCRTVERTVAQHSPAKLRTLHAPRHCQGYFWGDKAHLRPRWERLGLTKATVIWQDSDLVQLAF